MPTFVVTGPDGKKYRVTAPKGATREEVMARVQAQQPKEKPTSFWQGALQGIIPPAANAMEMVYKSNPLVSIAQQAADALGVNAPTPSRVAQVMRQTPAAIERKSKYRGSTAGKIAGGVVGTLPTLALPGGAIRQGMAGGAMMNESGRPQDIAAEAAIGGIAGKAGELIGSKLIAPVARKVAATKPVQAAVNALRESVGMAPKAAVPVLSQTEQTISRANPAVDEALQNLDDAARLGLPYSLADASPELRSLAGSVSRKAGSANALAERTFGPRSLGQEERANQAVSRFLAKPVDIRERAADIMEAGKPVYGPLYEKAYQGPVVTSPAIEGILATPAGKTAVGKASRIAANEMRDPRAMGFAMDDAGNVVLNPPPIAAMERFDLARQGWDAANAAHEAALRRQQASLTPGKFTQQVSKTFDDLTKASAELDAAKVAFAAEPRSGTVQATQGYTPQSLDYVKGGFDDMLEPYRNPVTNKLVLDREGRAINARKNELLSELDALNPDYKAARAAFGEYAGQEQALREGFGVLPSPQTNMDDFARYLERAQAYDAALPAEKAGLARVPEMQTGYASAMRDRIGNVAETANPYTRIYGSTNQQEKVGQLFPQGAEDFGRVYQLESDMAKTAWETLGGSPTQRRAMMDQLFDSNLGTYGEAALNGLTSPKSTLLRIAAQKLKDQAATRGEKRAAEIAPTLFDTNPDLAAAALRDMAEKNNLIQARNAAYARALGMGLGYPSAVIGASQGRP